MTVNEYMQSAKILAPVACWAAGSMLILLACCGLLPPPFATMGLSFVVVGCTATVCQQLRRMGMRERDAFELGRESMRIVRD